MNSKTRDRIIIILICVTAIIFGIVVKVLPSYYFNNGKSQLDKQNYVEAYNNLKKAYSFDHTNKDIRYYYVESLSHLVPSIMIQKELFEISDSKEHDSAQNLASIKIGELRAKLTAMV